MADWEALAKKAENYEKKIAAAKQAAVEAQDAMLDGGAFIAGELVGGMIDGGLTNPSWGQVDKSAVVGAAAAIVLPMVLGTKNRFTKKSIFFGLGMAGGEIRQLGTAAGNGIKNKLSE